MKLENEHQGIGVVLAELLGVAIPVEEIQVVAEALERYSSWDIGIGPDDANRVPALTFNPRWHE